jgi:fibronectin type 3 domain-containing protein
VNGERVYGEAAPYVSAEPTLGKPTNLNAVSADYDSIQISWDTIDGAAEYAVYRSTSKSGKYSLILRTSELSCTNTGATTGTTYYYKVVAVTKDANHTLVSNLSTAASATVK